MGEKLRICIYYVFIFVRSMEVKLWQTDQPPSDRPTDQQTETRVHKEVTLPWHIVCKQALNILYIHNAFWSRRNAFLRVTVVCASESVGKSVRERLPAKILCIKNRAFLARIWQKVRRCLSCKKRTDICLRILSLYLRTKTILMF